MDVCNFADDNSPYIVAPTIPKVKCQLENEASILLHWIENNGFKSNPDKFNLILSDANATDKIQLAGVDIYNSETAKLLGIKIDSKLKFGDHVTDLCKKSQL